MTKLKKWSELFPEGRHLFYEGDDPTAFVKEIKAKYGVDLRLTVTFDCPSKLLDEIYDGKSYPLGS